MVVVSQTQTVGVQLPWHPSAAFGCLLIRKLYASEGRREMNRESDLIVFTSARVWHPSNSHVTTDTQEDYEALKTFLLNAFGDTVEQAREQWFSVRRKQGQPTLPSEGF